MASGNHLLAKNKGRPTLIERNQNPSAPNARSFSAPEFSSTLSGTDCREVMLRLRGSQVGGEGASMHVSNESLLVILLVGLVAGWLAGKIIRGTGFGIIGDILIGVVGA